MWMKVSWLFIWTTLAFWVGCSAPQNEATLTPQPVAEDETEAPLLVQAQEEAGGLAALDDPEELHADPPD